MFQKICYHVKESTNGGTIVPMISIFPARTPDGKDKMRVWNTQFFSFAGYQDENDPKTIFGDPINASFTKVKNFMSTVGH